MIFVTVAAILLGISNVGLKTYNLVADASGEPKLAAYITTPVTPVGWRTRRTAVFNWAKPLFGDTSIWDRYVLRTPPPEGISTPRSPWSPTSSSPQTSPASRPTASRPATSSTATRSRDVAQVNVGGGITGQAMSYTSQTYGSWSIVYWIIPVKLGTATMYERVVLYVQNNGSGVVVPATAKISGISNVAGSLGPSDLPLIRNRAFLVAFARELIQAQAQWSASGHVLAAPAGPASPSPTIPPVHQGVDPAVSLTTN